jgi:4'-phosphopantetheinyl transferase
MAESVNWEASPKNLELRENEVHIWRAPLDAEAAFLNRFAAHLTVEEKGRADRFVFARDREHFVVGRGILRELLGRYLDRPPASLSIHKAPREKPYLSEEPGIPRLCFNVSHSHGLAVYSFALEREVGIDVELVRPDFASEEIAERYFSLRELEELRTLPSKHRAEGFFLCWTRKEAYIKARGEGLQIPLESFSVSLTPGQPEKLESTDSSRWTLHSFRPGPPYVGALVGESKAWRLRHLDWKP